MNSFSLDTYQRPVLETPNGERRMVLHSCCAPCAAEIMAAIRASKIEFTVFFFNPNIHPRDEYELRKAEHIRYAQKLGVPFVDADYGNYDWLARVRGLELEPERGKRCSVCFDMRLEHTAQWAHEHGFRLFSSTLGISRWKDMEQVNASGVRAAARWPGMMYWTFNWREQGGSARMLEISKRERFYQQEYCGCMYSLRDTNRWRIAHAKPEIVHGVKFYGMETGQAESDSTTSVAALGRK